VPWIHIQDLCGIFKFILDHKNIYGIFNAVSPIHTTNIGLTWQIAEILERKIFLPNIPKIIIQVLFGEMSIMVLEGSRVSSDKIIKNGFNFKHEYLGNALANLLKTNNYASE
jgi:NAD dependent epimerase/dehydratase family enzyme